MKNSSDSGVVNITVIGDNNQVTVKNVDTNRSSFFKKLAAITVAIVVIVFSILIAYAFYCRLLTVSDGDFISILEKVLESFLSSIVNMFR